MFCFGKSASDYSYRISGRIIEDLIIFVEIVFCAVTDAEDGIIRIPLSSQATKLFLKIGTRQEDDLFQVIAGENQHQRIYECIAMLEQR
jgi:hypothetical protein